MPIKYDLYLNVYKSECFRVLQLTSYVEDGGEKDNIAVLKALQAQIHGKMGAAHEFLNVSYYLFINSHLLHIKFNTIIIKFNHYGYGTMVLVDPRHGES